MMGGKGWEEALAPHQHRGWEVLGLLLLWCWYQGSQAEGKAFRHKQAGALPAEKLEFFPYVSKNSCSGVPIFQTGGQQPDMSQRENNFILCHPQTALG